MKDATSCEPFVEPWRTTALRTVGLAVLIGLIVGIFAGQSVLVPKVALTALWFTLGGHILELLFRNHLRQKLDRSQAVQVPARIMWWLVGGMLLSVGALATQAGLGGGEAVRWRWWIGGPALVAVELLVHLVLRVRGLPSFYDGRG